MFEVFLSYARENAAEAARLRTALERLKFLVWQDIQELRGGKPWEDQLGLALERVKVVLALLSPHSLDPASYVSVEWRHARLRGTPVIPLRVGPVDVWPNDLDHVHQYDFTGADNYAAMLALAEQLKELRASHYDPVRSALIPLVHDERFAALRPVFERLEQWVDAQVHPPEVLAGFVDLLRHADIAALRRSSAKDFLDSVTNDKAGWNAELRDVVAGNRNAFDMGLSTLRELVQGGRVIPIVLVVMTETEAEELASGTAFDGSPPVLREDFLTFQAQFEVGDRSAWPSRYRSLPKEWRPFAVEDRGETVEQLIRNAFAAVQSASTSLIPEFWDIRWLSDPANRIDLKDLRRSGCLMIIDGISIRHPKLQRMLQQSALDAYPATSVVTVAPVPNSFDVLQRVAVVLQLTIGDLEFARRVTDEGYAAEEADTPTRLGKWLRESAKAMGQYESSTNDIRGHLFGRRQ